MNDSMKDKKTRNQNIPLQYHKAKFNLVFICCSTV